jgi:hypothetical protein
MPPDPWQERVLTSPAARVLLCCSRQSGKSTVVAALALHEALYRPGSLILILARAERQSGELFRKCKALFAALGRPAEVARETTLELEFAGGSRLICLPGQEESVRSFSGVRLLVVDEAARVPDPLYFSIRPMLAISGGRLVALSTPFGRRGWFFHEWTEGPGWERVRIRAEECPRISAAFLAEERRALGPWWYDQEYECIFRDAQDQVFSGEFVERALSDAVEPLWL